MQWTLGSQRAGGQGIKWKGGLNSLQHLMYIVENIYKEGNIAYIWHVRWLCMSQMCSYQHRHRFKLQL